MLDSVPRDDGPTGEVGAVAETVAAEVVGTVVGGRAVAPDVDDAHDVTGAAVELPCGGGASVHADTAATATATAAASAAIRGVGTACGRSARG